MQASRAAAAALLLVVSFCASAAQTKDPSCGDKSAQIMILGTYHMDNPGQDAINLRADDVIGEKRQREIADLSTVDWGRQSSSNGVLSKGREG